MKKYNMELTRAEEQIMQILWKLEKGFIKDLLEYYDEPKPAYTTVATFMKILEKKGYVSYEPFGNAHKFYPLISKDEYSKTHLNSIFSRYFKSSIKDVVTFFSDNNKVNINDIDSAIKLLIEIKNKKS
jgi:BlaI family transcriptional regulator, penicillinase repressor